MTGVQAFVNFSDIPGVNSVTDLGLIQGDIVQEEIFSSGKIHYAGQALGLILADTYEHAR